MLSVAALTLLSLAPVPRAFSQVEFDLAIPRSSQGFSVVQGRAGELADPAEPNLPGVFAVGFDTSSPHEKDIFRGSGNIYRRPEREVSLHGNGRELDNRLSPAEIGGGVPRRFRVRLDAVPGGSEVTVEVAGTKVYDRQFVAGVKPASGWSMVVPKGTSPVLLRATAGRAVPEDKSKNVVVFEKALNDQDHHRQTQTVDLPTDVSPFARVIATLELSATPKGIDPWDRLASITMKGADGKRYEVLRYITPYRKGWVWRVDLTHLLPILQGKREFQLECETYAQGWLVDFDLEYVEGPLKVRPAEVRQLWSVTAPIGQANLPFEKSVPPQQVDVGQGWRKAEVWSTVTGHGMDPNTDNAAEFLALWRKLTVGGKAHQNTLWREDCYLNPCRPQGGTWKFDRAGWRPGDVVSPWTVDVTKELARKGPTEFRYEIQPYVNRTPAEGNPARHVIDSVLVLYR